MNIKNRKTKNRILAASAILGVMALLAVTSISAAPHTSADSAVPDGYTPIYTFEDLMAINTNSITLSGKYILMNDITFTDSNNAAFTPIGNSNTYPFTGIFDGNGHEISGMNVNISSSSSAVCAGLFGYVGGAQIMNLGVVDSTVTATSTSSSAYAGGIVGFAGSATISNCYNTGDVSATSSYYAYAGGIVGSAGSATISNCYNTGDVSASNTLTSSTYSADAGGIVGSGSPIIISNCYNTGDVSATSSSLFAYAGGMVGYTQSPAIIQNCCNTGNVTVTSISQSAYAGGIVGYVGSSSGAIIQNCYNTGDISASVTSTSSSQGAHAGGIVGGVGSSAIIQNCYNTGDVSASGMTSSSYYTCAGGIVGYGSPIISNCYLLKGVVSNNEILEDRIYGDDLTDVARDNGTGDQASGAKTMEQMTPTLQDAQNGNSIYYVGSGGWDFSDNGVWTIVEGENNGYPILQFHSDQSVSGGFVPILPYTPVSVIPNGYTPIYTFDDLMHINTDSTTLSGNYILMNDITFTSANNTAFIPIGSSGSSFTGIFDGNGHEISGMNVNISSSPYAGLFGYVSGAQIKNLGVIDSTVTATSSSSSSSACAGGIVGYVYSSAIISNCYNTGNVSASATSTSTSSSYAYAGGMVGYGSAIISNCYNTGSVSTSNTSSSQYPYAYAGGIAGSGSIISNCYNTGDVSATSSFSAYAGGIAGYAGSAITISNCYNTGNVAIISSPYNSYAGGIVGYAQSSAIISNCYNTGSVSASAHAGGIVGSTASAIISNCYNTGDVSATSSFSAYAGGIIGDAYVAAIKITNCYNIGSVTASNISSYSAYAGGIVGDAGQAIISNCYNIGSVSTSAMSSSLSYNAYAGGIIGDTGQAIISNCYNTGGVSAMSTSSSYAYAGGILGCAEQSSVTTILNCYNAGDVSATSTSSSYAYAGGIVGYVGIYSATTMTDCYNTGDVSASNTSSSYAYAGGIVGYAWISATITSNCYFLVGAVSHNGTFEDAMCGGLTDPTSILKDGGTGGQASGAKTMEQMTPTLTDAQSDNSTYYAGIGGWDFTSTWAIVEEVNNGYPILLSLPIINTITGEVTDGTNPIAGVEITYSGGLGTSATTRPDGTYIISAIYGSTVAITNVSKTGYTINGFLPLLFAMTSDKTQNFIMTVLPYTVTLTPGTGYTFTPSSGSSSPVESGGSFSFTMAVDPAYTVNSIGKVLVNGEPLTPVSDIYTITNITEDQTVTVVFDPIIDSSSIKTGGNSVEINGMIDPSAGATYVKVYTTFSDGSVINSTFTIGSLGDFSTGYSGSMTPVSYLITAYDGKPGTSGVNMVAWTETNSM